MHCARITPIAAAAALAIAAPVTAQPYGSATYGPAPPYAQDRAPSPIPAPGFNPPGGGYAYPYVPPAQRYGATAEAYGANAATLACAAQTCDQAGAYWSYGETLPYGTDAAARADPDAAAYVSRGCRLAPAASGSDQRYIRVCPDGQGKYRVGR